MTNEQIEKALELCGKGEGENCEQCPYSGHGCELKLTNDVLGYIRYLKRQIEGNEK